ncbi:hypothetical protein LTR66_002680 [Elasticomyces elasticus]|nr:hypothetical protein LTR66_002680 [Elasticomyces elasticus]
MNCYVVTEKEKRTGFNFQTLWDITQKIQHQCPYDTRLYNPENPNRTQLTNAACMDISGDSWTSFPAPEVIARIALWKLPLFQLVSLYPRPPLCLEVTVFVICHLLGDPIDTIWSLLYKLCATQSHATSWEAKIKAGDSKEQFVRDWKALALIESSYDECQKRSYRAGIILDELENIYAKNRPISDNDYETSIRNSCQKWAGALAADRSTTFLPVFAAELGFLFTIASAIAKTFADHTKPAFAINGHSLAFSVLYFWILPVVLLGSIVGVSQSRDATPRILKQLEEEIERSLLGGTLARTLAVGNDLYRSNTLKKNPPISSHVKWERIVLGGVHSWQPNKWDRGRGKAEEEIKKCAFVSTAQSRYLGILALVCVLDCTVSGIFISWITPPEGIDCRHYTELLIFVCWLSSAVLTGIFETQIKPANFRLRFYLTLAKDVLSTLATAVGILTAHIGIFNRCVCWTQWGHVGLTLPYEKFVADILSLRMGRDWPLTLIFCVLVQLAIFSGIWVKFAKAFRVFLQQDDGSSNIPDWV